MINNRQGGRRRGRGGGSRSPNTPNAGNRQDNRSRGNAAQLHEKYKAMARDAQLAGDRVQTEYYLQFADHYFRVLNESRARFEEQRRQREDDGADEDEDQEEVQTASGGDEGEEREERGDRPARGNQQRNDGGEERPRRQRARRSREDREPEQGEGDSEERISADILPPSIASIEGGEAKAPRRRTRRQRDEGDEEMAPAA